MENNQFPQPEEEQVQPEALTFSPAPAEEELPLIEEIPPMEQEAPMQEPTPAEVPQEEAAPEMPLPQEAEAETLPEEEATVPEDLPVPEVAPDAVSEEEAPRQESDMGPEDLNSEPPETPAPSFMDRIPDTNEDYPPEEDPSEFVQISDDDQAYQQILDEIEAQATQSQEPSPAQPEELPQQDAKEEPAPAPKPRPARKGRPKRKGGEGFFGIPSILVTLVWLALILVVGVTLGRMVWVCAADVLAFGREDKPVTVTIYEADSMEDITNKLYDAGLIRYKSLFSFYASISDAQEDIDPGIYDLNTRYDYHALVNMMSASSTREVVKVTIPEGYTCRQIFDLLQENKVCTSVDLGNYAANGELDDYWFLENIARGDKYCLEGFLFPDTYEFYKNDSPRSILQKMLNNFQYRFTEEMLGQLETLNANVTGGTYTVRELVIVASMIEKETAAASESPRIAGVIYNRLFSWGGTPAFLNIDASIVYAQDGDNSRIDTSIDSPYNTYLHTGLTPTAIANPGLASLQAALNPENHNYYYYVLNPSTGVHQFATTYEEHQANVSKFAAAAAAATEGE